MLSVHVLLFVFSRVQKYCVCDTKSRSAFVCAHSRCRAKDTDAEHAVTLRCADPAAVDLPCFVDVTVAVSSAACPVLCLLASCSLCQDELATADGAAAAAASTSSKKAVARVLDSKRSNAIAIMLSQLPKLPQASYL